jgi:PIN domain nuclease of toxin-antitoxin system
MRYLLDTQLVLWLPIGDARISASAKTILKSPVDEFIFSVASIWEIAIKKSLGKPGFSMDPGAIRQQMREHGYAELPIFGKHVIAVANLHFIHKDPFDRLLIAQSVVEGITLLTTDATISKYSGAIRRV